MCGPSKGWALDNPGGWTGRGDSTPPLYSYYKSRRPEAATHSKFRTENLPSNMKKYIKNVCVSFILKILFFVKVKIRSKIHKHVIFFYL